MTTSTALVTGATGGIGLHIARQARTAVACPASVGRDDPPPTTQLRRHRGTASQQRHALVRGGAQQLDRRPSHRGMYIRSIICLLG